MFLPEDSAAVAVAPGNADALTAVALVEEWLGRWDAVRAHAEEALRLDPRSPGAAATLGWMLLNTRRYSEAAQALDRGLATAPTFCAATSTGSNS